MDCVAVKDFIAVLSSYEHLVRKSRVGVSSESDEREFPAVAAVGRGYMSDARIVYHVQAANYLNIKNLLDLTCQTVADMIKGKTPEEIRKTFNIKNDFTPEEEEEVRRENQWAFE